MSEAAALCKAGQITEGADRRRKRPLAAAVAYEQLALILDEAEAAQWGRGSLARDRALERVTDMAREALPLMRMLVDRQELAEADEDIAEELARRAKKRKAWCPEPTPIAREFAMLSKRKKP